MAISEKVRERMLIEAIEAMRAYIAHGHDHTPEGQRLRRKACGDITRAVTSGDHIHTLISCAVPCSGLQVAELISDPEAHVAALLAEHNAADNYRKLVHEKIRSEAVGWAIAGGHGGVTAAAKRFGVTRATLYAWAAAMGADLKPQEGEPENRMQQLEAYYLEYKKHTNQLATRKIAKGWFDMGVSAAEAGAWAAKGFLPGEAETWVANGGDRPSPLPDLGE